MSTQKPLVISAPEPRSIDLIFDAHDQASFFDRYEVLAVDPEALAGVNSKDLSRARYILGQPPVSPDTLAKLHSLRCVFNVESNLINNMPYETLFQRGIHVVTTGAVFAEPVAEMGLAMALNLARQVIDADLDFREGREQWGADGNQSARLISGSTVGILGFGDLGKALARLMTGFRADVIVHDPWLPPSILREQGVQPVSLDQVLAKSDTLFVVASVTTENEGFLNAAKFAQMKRGASFILLSRANIVNFDDLMRAVETGYLRAASDVFPTEPLEVDHPVRALPNFIRSAHRAGALDVAFKRMGSMVLEDMALIDAGLPPMRCKRAERETVARMKSKPVEKN